MTAAPEWETFRRPPAPAGEVDVDRLDIGVDFRLDDDAQDLAELAASIAELGVLQPITVRRLDDGRLEVIAGRRRLAAARIAGLDTIPATFVDVDDDQAADVALAENLHRRDLSPVEVALAFARLRERGLNGRQIAARVGRSEATVSNYLRLLEIPAHLRERVHRRELGVGTALDLAGRRSYTPRGGAGTHGSAAAIDLTAVTYWRRRHDRLLAGVLRILRRRPGTALEAFDLLRGLAALDAEPIAGVATPEDARPAGTP